MATINNAYLNQKWADNGYWNAVTNDREIYAGYATSNDYNYVYRLAVTMPESCVSAQAKIAYRHDGSLNGKRLKYKVLKTAQDGTYGDANASTAGDGTLTIAASSGYFTINYDGYIGAGDTLYIYLWTAESTSVYTLCRIGATSKHTVTYTEGTASTGNTAGNLIGSPVSITIDTDNPSFAHTVVATFGTYVHTIATRTTATYLVWTPPLASLAPMIPNGTSITGTITVSTYNGSAFVGSHSYDLTLHLPDSVVPTIDASMVSVYGVSDNAKIQSWGIIVQNMSRLKAEVESGAAAGAYGSTITGYDIVVNGSNYSTLQTDVIAYPGTFVWYVRAIDSRGRTASVSGSVTVLPYFEPYLRSVEVYRCDSSGNTSDDGTYIYSKANAAYSDLDGNNTISMTLSWVPASGGDPSTKAISNNSADIATAGILTSATYYAIITVTDALGGTNSVRTTIKSTGKADFVIAPGHVNRAAFFKIPEREGLDVPAPVYADKVYVGGVTTDSVVSILPTDTGLQMYTTLPNGTIEWVNPPNIVNTEYRTSERWMGLPVYTQIFDCGQVCQSPGSFFMSMDTIASRVIRSCGVYGQYAIPYKFAGMDDALREFGAWVALDGDSKILISGRFGSYFQNTLNSDHLYMQVWYTANRN